MSSTAFWDRVNSIRKGYSPRIITTLKHEGKLIETDAGKAELFGQLLADTFKLNMEINFDDNFRASTEQSSYERARPADRGNEISPSELNKVLKHISKRTQPGEDGIYNNLLNHLSPSCFKLPLTISNKNDNCT